MQENHKDDAAKVKAAARGKKRSNAQTGGLQTIRGSRIVKKLNSAVFIELPAFLKYRAEYLNDAAFSTMQNELLDNPEAGDIIQDTGGLRKLRAVDEGRGKGKRSGIRIIYFWCEELIQFWLFTLYDKDELEDLTAAQKKILKNRLEDELAERVMQSLAQETKRKK